MCLPVCVGGGGGVCNAGKIKRRQVKIWNDLRAIYGNCSGAYQIDKKRVARGGWSRGSCRQTRNRLPTEKCWSKTNSKRVGWVSEWMNDWGIEWMYPNDSRNWSEIQKWKRKGWQHCHIDNILGILYLITLHISQRIYAFDNFINHIAPKYTHTVHIEQVHTYVCNYSIR